MENIEQVTDLETVLHVATTTGWSIAVLYVEGYVSLQCKQKVPPKNCNKRLAQGPITLTTCGLQQSTYIH